jgi:hypothetical protein
MLGSFAGGGVPSRGMVGCTRPPCPGDFSRLPVPTASQAHTTVPDGRRLMQAVRRPRITTVVEFAGLPTFPAAFDERRNEVDRDNSSGRRG